jgi:3-oxoacyl-[acyl-carrier protein] reductase
MTARPKSALITGSSVRVGKAIALRLARDGWFVLVHVRSDLAQGQACLAEVRAAGGDGCVVMGDISSRQGCEDLFAQIPEGLSLDLLVNNVGIYQTGPLSQLSPDSWDAILRTNLDGTFHCSQLAIPRLRRGGSIINLGYVGVDRLAGTKNAAAYSVTKTGILVLTRSLALELAGQGIRVNMVSPGQLDNSVDLPSDYAQRIPLGRPGTSLEVADAIAWLASEQASYITGQNLDVAGGLMLGLRGEN